MSKEITYELQYSPEHLYIIKTDRLEGDHRQGLIARQKWYYGGDAQYSYFTATKEEAKKVMTDKLKEQIGIYNEFAKENGLIL